MKRKAKKKSFLVYNDWADSVSQLTNEQAGMLFKAVLAFHNNAEIPKLDVLTSFVFNTFKPQFERDAQAYKDKCERNSTNAKQRWENADECERMPSDADECERNTSIQTNANDADIDIDLDNDIDNDNKIIGKGTSNATFDVAHEPKTREEILFCFNEILSFYDQNRPKTWKSVVSIDGNRGQRERHFRMNLEQCNYSLPRFKAIIKHALINLDVDSNAWKCVKTQSEFDNLIKPEFFQMLHDSAKQYWDSTRE